MTFTGVGDSWINSQSLSWPRQRTQHWQKSICFPINHYQPPTLPSISCILRRGEEYKQKGSGHVWKCCTDFCYQIALVIMLNENWYWQHAEFPLHGCLWEILEVSTGLQPGLSKTHWRSCLKQIGICGVFTMSFSSSKRYLNVSFIWNMYLGCLQDWG